MARGRTKKRTEVQKGWEKKLGWKARFYREERGTLVGKQIGGFRIKDVDEESELFLQWIQTQSNLSDAIRYLIEKDIVENGLRDLSVYIPRKRIIDDVSHSGALIKNVGLQHPFPSITHQSQLYGAAPSIPQHTEAVIQQTETKTRIDSKMPLSLEEEKKDVPSSQVEIIDKNEDSSHPLVKSDDNNIETIQVKEAKSEDVSTKIENPSSEDNKKEKEPVMDNTKKDNSSIKTKETLGEKIDEEDKEDEEAKKALQSWGWT